MEKQKKDGNPVEQRAAIAAATAVALALKAEETTIRAFPLPSRVLVSAWQAVLRSNTHSTRGKVR